METYITTNERIADLRNMSGLTQKELCDKADIPYSTLSRIERGEITNVSNDILIKLSNFFNVSTDYLLELTNVKFRKNIELSALGLSNKALFALLSGNLNTDLLSRMIEHPHFVTLLDSADAYFTDATKAGIQSRNDIISLATGGIRDFIKLHPEKRQECNRDIRHLNAEKIGGDEADLNKLRNIFMAILKDIKADYGKAPQDMSQNMFQEQYEIIKAKRDEIKEERDLTEDDMAKITTEMLIESGTLDMDKTEKQLFFELFKHMLKRTYTSKNRDKYLETLGDTNVERNVTIIKDLKGHNIVLINDIYFKGRQNIEWNEVEKYLKQYVGEFIEIIDTNDIVYIGNDLADEYTGSKYTAKLKGTYAKAKANAAQGLPELVKTAINKRYKENLADKHNINAKHGWYRYDSRFALPVYDNTGDVERYNVFHVELIVRHAADGKLYLYDMINIKKETGTPL